ncbi:hypothetical protein J6590_105906 [Homalodisca vitripennis]|nr:hypothetical protein J6590_105906 [Homalodisca vitripennis]
MCRDHTRVQRHQCCLTVRENVNRLAPISQTKILTSTFHNGCDLRLKNCRIRTHRNHQLPTWSHSQNSSACAAFCFRAVCVPFELRWWKRDHVQNILLYQSANSAVPTAAARPESHLLKTVGTPPGHSPNDNVQGGEVKTTVQSRAWRTRKSPSDSKAGHSLDTSQTSYHRLSLHLATRQQLHTLVQWNVPESHGGSEQSAQLGKENIQPPLQANRSHTIFPRSFIGTERIDRPLDPSEGYDTVRQTPLQMSGALQASSELHQTTLDLLLLMTGPLRSKEPTIAEVRLSADLSSYTVL